MNNMSIDDIIFDLYLVMKFKKYNKLEISMDSSVDTKMIPILDVVTNERGKNSLMRRGMFTLFDVLDLMSDSKRLESIRSYGKQTNATTKENILTWWVNYNMTHKRHPLYGVRLERI